MRDQRKKASGDRVLHNMSAPPRTRVDVRPLRHQGQSFDGEEQRDLPGGDAGMVLITTVCLDCLIQHYFPHYQDISPVDGRPSWRDGRRLKGTAARRDNLRLRCLVVLSRLALCELRRPSRQVVHRLADVPAEELESTWLENVGRLRPEDHRLPTFGLVRPVSPELLRGKAIEMSLARALIVVSRSGGSVYSRGRKPGLPNYSQPITPIELYGFSFGGQNRD